MSNILFVLYHDFSANSAVHVHNFANQLAGSGHSVAVAIPNGDDTGSALGEQHYSVLAYHEVDGNWTRVFSNGLPPMSFTHGRHARTCGSSAKRSALYAPPCFSFTSRTTKS